MLEKKQKIHFIQDYDARPERVFSFFSDHHRLSEIYPGAFKRIVDSTDPRNINGIGSVRRIINFPIILEETITRFQEPSLIEYRVTHGGPLKNHKGTMNFYPLDEGARTRLDYTIEFEGKIPFTGYWLRLGLETLVGGAIRELARRFSEDPNY